MLRRNDLPVVLKNTAGQKLKEADHFKITRHPEFGDYGQYDPSHEIAPIEIAPESQLVAGDTIRVSYFHAQMPDVEPHRVCCSLRHPNVMKIHSDQIQLLEKRLAPKRWFINHDEIRGMGHEPTATEVTPKISPATLLRSHLIKCLEVIKRKGGNKPVILNSDMYDPFHNAVTASQRESYYPMVNGSFTGSWIPITETELKDPPAITVWNWNLADGNARNRQREVASSFVHFKGLGYPQVVGSFYDVDDSRVRSHIDEAFRMAKSHAGTVSAVCYYTALHKYDHLERFAESAEKIFGK